MARPRKQQRPANGRRAVIYLRVSKEDGATKHGLPIQLAECLHYVERSGYTVVGEPFKDDGVSGAVKLANRPGLSDAFGVCRAGDADLIVAYNQDRLARKMGVFEEIPEEAIKAGLRLETTDGRVLTAKDDHINGDVMALVSAIERRRISERFYLARRERSRRDGRGSGVVPFGYKVVPYVESDQVLSRIEVDEKAAPIVRVLLNLRAQGETYQATADALNAAGYTTPTGSRWTVGHVQGIERREHLYRTGQRVWDGVRAEDVWPRIM